MADDFDETVDKPVDAGPPRPKGEGVRIIGAEEAAAALESGSASPRTPDDEPRFGDRPAPPDTSKIKGPDVTPILSARSRPSPWGAPEDDAAPADVGSTQPIEPLTDRGGDEGASTALPHWTEPPTGEVPRIFAGRGEPPRHDEDDADDDDVWPPAPERTGSVPRWRDQQADWEASDFDDVAELGGGRQDDEPAYADGPYAGDGDQPQPPPVRTRLRPPAPGPDRPYSAEEPAAAPRNVPVAIGTGVAFGVFALLMFRAGSGPALALSVTVVGLAAVELFAVLRKAGYRPATLLGITSSVSVMLAAYAKGETAIPLVLALTMVCALLWFMFGVVRARPTMNVGVTLLGVVWVGFLGSFAALLLRAPDRRGIAFLLGAIIATVAYDVGALVVGSRNGRTPLAPEISPNKTWEGIMGGAGAALLASVLVTRGIHPWDLGSALALGLVTAFMAPLGDLSQSLIKRDLGIKDMGTLLPGHGGVMDRFDALLFVLPATYYLVRLLQLA